MMNTQKSRPHLKPPLKWAGGKRWLVPHLVPLWANHSHRRLVEPFCGSLAVSLGLMPDRALLTDANPHLINFYMWLQRGLHITIQTRNDRDLFLTHRTRFNELITDGGAESCEAAELFYFLNRTGFNGLCRFNSKGEFNVPFGKYATINYMTDFSEYAKVLSRWQFRVCPFRELELHPDDFVYADPPYDVEFVQYSKDGFTWADQVALAEKLAVHPGPVVLSNQATDRIIDLYKQHGFTLQLLESPRRISANGDRTPALEVLAIRNLDISAQLIS
jgi:DNA adenine methylase